jgi:hypothetical protein
VRNASKVRAKPIPLGTFTNEKRWTERTVKSPGVGEYDLTGYKNFSKAAETTFVIPDKQTNITGSGDKRSYRAKSAMYRGQVSEMHQTSKSRSPSRGQLNQSVSTRRLGGPQHPNTNFMMQTTRFQRAMLFSKETESAQMNSLGQGPAAYDIQTLDKEGLGKKFAYTMPKVSFLIIR